MVLQSVDKTHDDHERESKSVLITSGCTDNHLNGLHRVKDQHKYRRTLSQVLATVAKCLLLLDLGMMIVVPTIVNGVLHNAKEGLSLNDSQASWFGSIMFLIQPVGSVLSGCVQGVLGRKNSMLLVNVPHLAGWYLLYSAESVEALYAAAAIMGFGMGFLEAPALAYIGEISEPRLRGTLATFANFSLVIGNLLEYAFGCVFRSWRHAMLVSCSVPIITALALSRIPESPIWLLTKGRKSEAMSAVKWLRGWVSDDEVRDEFRSLELYCETSENEYRTQWETRIGKKPAGYTGVPDGENVTTREPGGFVDVVRDMLRPEILKPLRLIVVLFFFYQSASLAGMRPYMIEVFTRLEVSDSPNMITVVSALLQCSGALTCICLVRVTGKRALALASMTSCSACCLSLAAYTYASRRYKMPAIPLALFCVLFYSKSVGILPIPWLLIGEVFPTRGRGMAGGVCAAIFYVMMFLVCKTWMNLHDLVGLHGCFAVYGIFGVLGIAYVFFCVPETEGKSLAEIEKYFKGKTNDR